MIKAANNCAKIFRPLADYLLSIAGTVGEKIELGETRSFVHTTPVKKDL